MGEKRRFLDRVLRFMGIEEEELAASDDGTLTDGVPDAEAYGVTGRSNARRPPDQRPTHLTENNARMRMVVLEPQQFTDVQAIADHLIGREPVVLSLDHLERETARRILDFLGGTTYALGGHIQRLGDNMFLLAPNNVEVDMDRPLPDDPEQEDYAR